MKLIECVDKETRSFDSFTDEDGWKGYRRDEKGIWMETEWGVFKKVTNLQWAEEIETAYQEWLKEGDNSKRDHLEILPFR